MKQLIFSPGVFCSGGDSCCSDDHKCGHGEGDCDKDSDCKDGLICGENNCQMAYGAQWSTSDDCCFEPSIQILFYHFSKSN